jgi:phage/plasmid-associated DNA primase
LLSFTNGYIDLSLVACDRAPVLQPHQPTNYVSMTTGYAYDGSANDAADNEVSKMFAQILPDEKARDFYLEAVGSSLAAANNFEMIVCCIGNTRNGKGVVDTAVKAVFGDFAGELEPQNLHRSYDPEKPRPALTSIHKKRYVMVGESGGDCKGGAVDEQLLNKMSGRDCLNHRELYRSNAASGCGEAHYTLFMALNDPWSTTGSRASDALYRRLKYVRFPVTFKETPDPTNADEQQLDTGVKTAVQAPAFRNALLRLLLRKYAGVYNTGAGATLRVPDAMKAETSAIHHESNPMKMAIDDILVADSTAYGVTGQTVLVAASTVAEIIGNYLRTEHQVNKSPAAIKTLIKQNLPDAWRPRHSVVAAGSKKEEEGVRRQIDCIYGYKFHESDHIWKHHAALAHTATCVGGHKASIELLNVIYKEHPAF